MSGQRVVTMIHVPDVLATARWYESIGFAVVNTFADNEDGEGDGLMFAVLAY